MLYAIVFLFVYLMLAILSKGTSVAWTWYAFVWVWWLAPVPFTILLIIMPVFITVMAFVARSGVSASGKNSDTYPDRRRTNPVDRGLGQDNRRFQKPVETKPRTVQDRVDEVNPGNEVEARSEQPVIDPSTLPDLDALLKQPGPEYTKHKKPPQPRVWGIDE